MSSIETLVEYLKSAQHTEFFSLLDERIAAKDSWLQDKNALQQLIEAAQVEHVEDILNLLFSLKNDLYEQSQHAPLLSSPTVSQKISLIYCMIVYQKLNILEKICEMITERESVEFSPHAEQLINMAIESQRYRAALILAETPRLKLSSALPEKQNPIYIAGCKDKSGDARNLLGQLLILYRKRGVIAIALPALSMLKKTIELSQWQVVKKLFSHKGINIHEDLIVDQNKLIIQVEKSLFNEEKGETQVQQFNRYLNQYNYIGLYNELSRLTQEKISALWFELQAEKERNQKRPSLLYQIISCRNIFSSEITGLLPRDLGNIVIGYLDPKNDSDQQTSRLLKQTNFFALPLASADYKLLKEQQIKHADNILEILTKQSTLVQNYHPKIYRGGKIANVSIILGSLAIIAILSPLTDGVRNRIENNAICNNGDSRFNEPCQIPRLQSDSLAYDICWANSRLLNQWTTIANPQEINPLCDLLQSYMIAIIMMGLLFIGSSLFYRHYYNNNNNIIGHIDKTLFYKRTLKLLTPELQKQIGDKYFLIFNEHIPETMTLDQLVKKLNTFKKSIRSLRDGDPLLPNQQPINEPQETIVRVPTSATPLLSANYLGINKYKY